MIYYKYSVTVGEDELSWSEVLARLGRWGRLWVQLLEVSDSYQWADEMSPLRA